ncbi:hypothetical protein EON64_17245, partial [archaeon]
MMKALPEVSDQDLLIWDDSRGKCCGYLNKKASQASAFSKGKWQKRWFVIETEIDDNENYKLLYFHGPDDKTPRQTFPLASSTLKIVSDTSFVLMMADDSSLTLSADSPDMLRLWITTLEKVVSVANMRERLLEHFDRQSESSEHRQGGGAPRQGRRRTDEADEEDEEGEGRGIDWSASAQVVVQRDQALFPMLRIDVDLQTVPPGSAERHSFISQFCADLAAALDIEAAAVQVLSLRSAPGKDWLSLVQFTLRADLLDSEQGSSRQRQADPSTLRLGALRRLEELVADPSSPLYLGYVTSRLDPSYLAPLREVC